MFVWSGSVAADMRRSEIEEIKRLHLDEGRLLFESFVFAKLLPRILITAFSALLMAALLVSFTRHVRL